MSQRYDTPIPWTPTEIQQLRKLYPTAPQSELTKTFKRSMSAIKSKASKEGIRRKRHGWWPKNRELRRSPLNPVTVKCRNRALTPNWIVGFVDGEGCFCFSFQKHRADMTCSTRVTPSFQIGQRNRNILEKVKDFFGFGAILDKCGKVKGRKGEVYYIYRVMGYEGCRRIRKFFETYTPILKKKEFEIWCSMLDTADQKLAGGLYHFFSEDDIKVLKSMRKEQNKIRRGIE